MPSAEIIIDTFTNFIHIYGLPFIFIVALLESIILLGAYFPGTIIAFGAITTTVQDVKYFILCVIAAICGIICGYIIDFYLGRRYGLKIVRKLGLETQVDFIKEKIIQNKKDHQDKNIIHGDNHHDDNHNYYNDNNNNNNLSNNKYLIPLFYYLPGTGAMTSIILGSVHIVSVRKFLIIIVPTVVTWNILWGGVLYFFGQYIVDIILKYLPIFILTIMLIILIKNRKQIFE